jgi:two-component system, NtrC family, nitrogen regulation response regulator NtrX
VTILLIVSEASDRGRLAEVLERNGHAVVEADSGTQARSRMPPGGTEMVVVLDLAGGPDALRFLRGPASTRGGAPVVCIADRRQPATSSEALRLGVADLVGRPVREADLVAAIANAREFARALAEDKPTGTLDLPADSVFGSSPAIREVLAIVRRIAPSRCGVLIVGERGSGREMVARAIHAQGPNKAQAFLKIACSGGWTPDLEPLLKGARPDAGTVYFENIHELTPDNQRRLGEYIRHPGAVAEPALRDAAADRDQPDGSEVRFIGSAPPRLLDLAGRDQIRRELVDALGVVRIDLPPLRQRVEDVPLLATHFLKEECRRNDVPLKAFSRSALMLLAAMPWPGNAAELRSLAERLAVLIPRGTVLLEDVLANVRFDGAEAMGRTRSTLREARERFERDYIVAVLQHHRGRMGDAARELGIERTNLYRKIKQLNVTWTTGAD